MSQGKVWIGQVSKIHDLINSLCTSMGLGLLESDKGYNKWSREYCTLIPHWNRPVASLFLDQTGLCKVLMRAEYINILMCSNTYIIWLEQFTMCCWNAHNCWLISCFFPCITIYCCFHPNSGCSCPVVLKWHSEPPKFVHQVLMTPFCFDITVMSYHSSIMIDSVL